MARPRRPETGKHVRIIADRRTMPRPTPAVRCDPPTPNSAFQRALQEAIDEGRVLELNSDITLDVPVAVRIRHSQQGWFGLDGRLHKIFTKNGNGPALRFYMDHDTPVGTCARGMMVRDFCLRGNGEGGGLQLDIPFNDRWLVNLELRSLWFEGCRGKAACTIAGSIFESFGYNVGTQDNEGAGMYFANAGAADNKGIVSAFRLYGGTHRQNEGEGILMDQYDGPADVRMYGLYFCGNAKPGIASLCGLELVDACGFENNHDLGIYFENFATLRKCTGSTYGPQPLLVKGYMVNPVELIDCSVAGYGGGSPRLAHLDGWGTLTARGSDTGLMTVAPDIEVLLSP